MKLEPNDFMAMNDLADQEPVYIDLVYSRDEPPNIFGALYKPEARLWLHKDLADIVIKAARAVRARYGFTLVLYDGLRPVEAQEAMMRAPIVRQNPHWTREPGRLISPPGAGAHPRGMAVDCSLMNAGGALLDMGTGFDHFAEKPDSVHNPAHRSYVRLAERHAKNRAILDDAMRDAARMQGHDLILLSQEWWDFRFPAERYERFAPVSDKDLPETMKIVLDQ